MESIIMLTTGGVKKQEASVALTVSTVAYFGCDMQLITRQLLLDAWQFLYHLEPRSRVCKKLVHILYWPCSQRSKSCFTMEVLVYPGEVRQTSVAVK